MTYRGIVLLPLLVLLTACATTTGDGLETDYKPNEVAEANTRLGVAYMNDGDYDKALEKLERARSADPRYPAVHNMLGLLYQRLGEAGRAESSFKRGLSLAPNEPDILNNYGQFLCSQDRPAEAEETFLKARRNPLNENPELALTNAGTCALRNNNRAKAERYYREALELNPRQPFALLQLADIQFRNEEYLSARGYFQRYLGVARQNARSLWLGVRIENALGDQDAVSSYALLLKSNYPDSREVQLLRESGIR